jgi:single-strand DNA-binding protein
VENYVKKGTQIYIEGEIDYRSWESNGEKKYATDIVATTIQLLGKKDSQSAPQSPAPQQKPKTTPIVDDLPPDDSGLPF